ncbi:hypothetical protein MtrunA17_Chr2g0299251 [Medicago truncatula]|uniref:Uncharacterized protein n=1 Tax=Medicago truncatula TaxID=3880 RepID=A0A396J5T1_MEDTR|nr:hypothetical protein MtrunA17_Chr2g0299251 [Medicago truncatula]
MFRARSLLYKMISFVPYNFMLPFMSIDREPPEGVASLVPETLGVVVFEISM